MEDRLKRKRRRKIRRIVTKSILYCFILAVGAFVVFQVYRAVDTNISTEPAIEHVMYQTINVDGYAVRNEEIVTDQNQGVRCFEVDTAQRVEKNGTIALIFPDESAIQIKDRISEIDNEINNLEQIGYVTGIEPSVIDKQIDEKLNEFIQITNRRNLENIDNAGEELLQLFNKRQVLTNDENVNIFESRIKALNEEKQSLQQQMGTSPVQITAGSAGYFSPQTDGCEGLVNYADVTDMTVDEFALLPEKIQTNTDTNIVGKIVKDYTWYLVFEIPQENLPDFYKGMVVDAKFSSNDTESVPMTLVSINSSKNSSGSIGVLKCTNMTPELINIRRQTVQLNIKSYKGLRISTKAVRFDQDDNMGVYVLEGNMAVFKLIDPIYTTDSFVLCSTEAPEEQTDDTSQDNTSSSQPDDTSQTSSPGSDQSSSGDGSDSSEEDLEDEDDIPKYEYLSLYDEVIVEGKDLSNGKIVS